MRSTSSAGWPPASTPKLESTRVPRCARGNGAVRGTSLCAAMHLSSFTAHLRRNGGEVQRPQEQEPSPNPCHAGGVDPSPSCHAQRGCGGRVLDRILALALDKAGRGSRTSLARAPVDFPRPQAPEHIQLLGQRHGLRSSSHAGCLSTTRTFSMRTQMFCLSSVTPNATKPDTAGRHQRSRPPNRPLFSGPVIARPSQAFEHVPSTSFKPLDRLLAFPSSGSEEEGVPTRRRN
jgi:hypothetical protein